MESKVEEVFEIQKYNPIRGWLFSLLTDRPGNPIHYNPSSTRHQSNTSLNETTLSFYQPDISLEHGWMWSHSWIPDIGYTNCDEYGWCYGSSISRLNTHLAKGTSKHKKEVHHWYRRRRWVRTRVRTSHLNEQIAMTPFNILGSLTETENAKNIYKIEKKSSLSHILHARSSDPKSFLHLELNDNDIVKAGWLGKCGSFSRNWKLRYFILRRDTNSLIYLKDNKGMVQLGEVHINGHTSVISEPTGNPFQFLFIIVNGDKELKLNSNSARVRGSWISEITEMIIQCRSSFLEASEGSEIDKRHFNDSKAFGVDGCTTHKPKCWKPYRIICSTLNNRIKNIENFYELLQQKTMSDLALLINETCDISLEHISELENNLKETATSTASHLSEPVLRELQILRSKISNTQNIFIEKLEKLKKSGPQSILVYNQFRRDFYMRAKHWLDTIFIHAQITLRPAHRHSPKGKIPMHWFGEDGKDLHRKSIQYFQISYNNSDLCVRKRSSSTGKLSGAFQSMSSSFRGRLKKSSPRKEKETRVNKLLLSLPEKLIEGHPELPSGINDLVVFVHENDLGSIIAFVLVSKAYVQELQNHHNTLNIISDLNAHDDQIFHNMKTNESSFKHHMEVLKSNTQHHIDLDFTYESAQYKHHIRCVSFFASQFHCLRHAVFPGNVGYMQSLCISGKFDATGGKSGAGFSMTQDERYILKEIPLCEFNMFVHMALSYFMYMERVMQDNLPTSMGKILGLYKVTRSKGLQKNTVYVIVVENILVGHKQLTQIYDLKGLVRRRYVETDENSKDSSKKSVLQDGNFMDCIPVPVFHDDLNVLCHALDNDTEFLCNLGVIDYSMLLAFDEENRHLVVGLIDYLHQYDFMKKMEHTSKASITFHNPTIISPVPYRKRFTDAIQRYFVAVAAPISRRISQPLIPNVSNSCLANKSNPPSRLTSPMDLCTSSMMKSPIFLSSQFDNCTDSN